MPWEPQQLLDLAFTEDIKRLFEMKYDSDDTSDQEEQMDTDQSPLSEHSDSSGDSMDVSDDDT